ncbi:MAG: hypothetical protein M3Q50_06030 [Chloroflexota bacterium]|nr:hypothetical protein [Chloroflexota bacterium]
MNDGEGGAPGTLRHVMMVMNTDVETTLVLVADMVGMTKDAVTKIVATVLPLMATVADEDPWVFKAMYAQSVKPLPEPTAELYTTLGKNPQAPLAPRPAHRERGWGEDFYRAALTRAKNAKSAACGASMLPSKAPFS